MPYTVIKGTVRHNGKDYKVGEEVLSLEKEEAERLLELNVVEEKSKSKPKPKPAAAEEIHE
ncbi:DUF7210 family protein [Brevibacillus reuszeri]|uniref:DUF7210 family protein n=1 Tax=Brevibacillus reuszeri TaxID=54915 RepID=UPI00289910F6|nr:hypothetical protein [Brevibacillus reuszeri]